MGAVSNAAATKMDPETEPLNAGATDDPKVKFTGGSETVDVEKGGSTGGDGSKAALTKAELMKYATDPFWVRLRWLKSSIEEYNATLPNKAWPNFYLGKHGQSRVATRTDPKHVNTLNMILMMLPGTPITYFGEEIGMEDGSGALMQWNAEAAAEENSPIKIYKQVSSLRDSEVLLFGSLEMRVDGDVFVLSRLKKGNPGYILITNFGDAPKTISVVPDEEGTDPAMKNPTGIPNTADKGILTMSTPKNPDLLVGASINMAEISIPPGTTYLMTFVPNF